MAREGGGRMKENMLRPPTTSGEWFADAVRVVGVLSVVVAAIWLTPTDAAIVALALPGVFLPRMIAAAAWFDAVLGITVLVASWSNVFDLYTTVAGWDVLVHFVCTGAVAALLHLLLARAGFIIGRGDSGFTPAGAVIVTTALGLALSVLWEILEWFGHAFISDDIFVTYADTIGDMAAGGAGSICAGLAVAFLPLTRSSVGGEPPRQPR
ncbi:hypothetical protein M4I32_04735 [Microbacterium sp. LRZ72]|uniref:hypothetical protein n=1 Tax=Microbacterium sp. LRZ72 TaxID=2942481 RepID=UPI0029AC0FFF|nr:hypothetical protein [Microbacterium sp. LRZ72]MDX2376104.1 hypothetical protein [Microbacterium sp. LRZ72]